MEKDELLKRLQIMQHLQSIDSKKDEKEDSYAKMDKDQLISIIHFLEKCDVQRAQDTKALKETLKELSEAHKRDLQTQEHLMQSIDNLSRQLETLTTQNQMLSEQTVKLTQIT